METHTPGPWTLVMKGNFRPWVTTDDQVTVADCPYPADAQRSHERIANARLIAAAPDLLAALRRMLGCHQAAMDAAQSSAAQFVDKSCECGACNEARTAIAKAEGRSR